MKADLHNHTTASDGTYTPEKLVQLAQRKKIDVLSVTDHDTTAALPQIESACKKAGIQFISGIEISCHVDDEEVHILAYGIPQNSEKLEAFLQLQLQDRLRRLKEILVQLEKVQVDLSFDDVKHHIHSESAAGRPHVARALVYKGYAPSIHEAFRRYLVPGTSGYVPRQKIAAEKVLQLILEVRALPVLAHPGLIKKQEHLESLVDQGLAGIEAYHPIHAAWQRAQYEKWATERKLLVTGGSDFHGDQKKGHGSLGSIAIPQTHIEHFLSRVN